jgi:hypothetical protein
MDTTTYDVLIIGAGPVGENTADRVTQGGLSAAIVERRLVAFVRTRLAGLKIPRDTRAVLQDSVDPLEKRVADLHRVGEAALDHRAVAQHDEMPARELGWRLPDLREQISDGAQEPLAVSEDGLVNRMLGIRILRDGVEEGTSAEAVRLDTAGDRLGDGPQDVGRRSAAAEGLADLIAIGLVDRLQVRDDEFFLTGKVPVQRRAGHLRLRDDPIDADGVDPLGVEEPSGGFKQPRSRFGNLTLSIVRHHRNFNR